MVVLFHGLATNKRYILFMCRCCHATTAELLIFCIPTPGNCILRCWLRHGDTRDISGNAPPYTKCTKKCQLCLSEKLQNSQPAKKVKAESSNRARIQMLPPKQVLAVWHCTIHYTLSMNWPVDYWFTTLLACSCLHDNNYNHLNLLLWMFY